jgi:hypothetical protein
LKKEKDYFPFGTYTHSTFVKEYNRDVRRKNYIIKYVNLLCIDNQDSISLNKMVQNVIFFRNVFSKDAILKFFLKNFKENEKEVIGTVIFELIVKSEIGEIGEHKEFYMYATELYKYVNHDHVINKYWEEIKNRQDVGI